MIEGEKAWANYEIKRGDTAFQRGAELARSQVMGADYVDPRDYFDETGIPRPFEHRFMAGYNAVAPNGGYCVLRGKIIGFSVTHGKMSDYAWIKR